MMIYSEPTSGSVRRIKPSMMAEEVGFEPTVPCGTTVFKTAAFDHSATPPSEMILIKLLYRQSSSEVYTKKRCLMALYPEAPES